MRTIFCLALVGPALLGPMIGCAQGIDSVFVEIFNVRPSTVAGGPDLTTYRIYVDLAEGYELQMVYGDQHHSMRIETTTEFFNSAKRSVKYGDRVDISALSDADAALDSWLTIGAIGRHHMGVPRALDTDGSVLDDPAPAASAFNAHENHPLYPSDGMIEVPAAIEIVNFKHEPGYLGESRGSLVETSDGAWAVLGGMRGATDMNICLLAQVSTTGTLSFKLNLQIKTPDHGPVKYVAANAREGEVLYEGLAHGSRAR